MPECPKCDEIFNMEEKGSFWDDTKNTECLCPKCGYRWDVGTHYDNRYKEPLSKVSVGDKK